MLENFLDTSETIGRGLGFPFFGFVHLSWLVAISVACVLAVYFFDCHCTTFIGQRNC